MCTYTLCTGVDFMVRSGFREYEVKNCVLLPAAGRKTQLFLLIFTEPGAQHKVHPCSRNPFFVGRPSMSAMSMNKQDIEAFIALKRSQFIE